MYTCIAEVHVKEKFLHIAGAAQLSLVFVYPTHAWPSYIWKKKKLMKVDRHFNC